MWEKEEEEKGTPLCSLICSLTRLSSYLKIAFHAFHLGGVPAVQLRHFLDDLRGVDEQTLLENT